MNMNIPSIIVDVALAIVIIIGMVSGVKRGFVKTVAAPVKLAASLAFAFTVCDTVSAKFIEPIIKMPIANQLKDFMYDKCADLTAENVSTELPTLLKMSAGMFGIDIEEVASTSVTSVIESIIDAFTDPIVHIVGIIVAFVLSYIAAKIITSLLIMLIDLILSAGPLGIINKGLGLIFGTAFAFIIAWAGVAVAEFAMGFVGFEFEAGYVYNFFNGFNPLDLLLSF